MSESKHTPGPWKVTPDDNGNGYRHTISRDGVGWWIASITGGQPSESEANARLIAAAPELLEVCKLALMPFTNEAVGEERREVCRAAISKAEGASSVPSGSETSPASYNKKEKE